MSKFERIQDILYQDQEIGKINRDIDFEFEIEEDDQLFHTEWSPNSEVDTPRVFSVAGFHGLSVGAIDNEPPDTLPAFQAIDWPVGRQGVDLRPHVWDSKLEKFLLLDSGSEVTAFPPDPGDVPVSGMTLRAVNGPMFWLQTNSDSYWSERIQIQGNKSRGRQSCLGLGLCPSS